MAKGQDKPPPSKGVLAGAAIGTGAAIGGLFGAYKLMDKMAASKARGIVAKSAKKVAEKTALQRAAKQAGLETFKKEAKSEVAARQPHPFSGLTARDSAPGRIVAQHELVEHQIHATAREQFHRVTARHVQTWAADPARKDWKYYSKPYNAEHPPQPGRYVPPKEHKRLVERESMQEEKRRVSAKVKARDFDELRRRISSTAPLKRKIDKPSAFRAAPSDLERRVKTTQFDISLKESRGPGGRFASGGGPMLSPRDMQNAYHAPFKEPPPEKKSIGSKVKKAAVIGAGIAASVGGAALLSPSVRRKILGKAIQETNSVAEAAAPAGTPFAKGTRELVESNIAQTMIERDRANAEKIARIRAEAESAQTILKSSHKVNTEQITRENQTHKQLYQEATGQLEAEKKAHLKTQDLLEAHKEALKGAIHSPILDTQGRLANPTARSAMIKGIVNRQGQTISNPIPVTEQLKQRLSGNPKNPREKGHLNVLADRITENQGKLEKAEREGATVLQKDKLRNAIKTDSEAHRHYSTVLKDLNEGAIDHPQISEHLYDIEIQTQRKTAEEDINKEINRIARERAANRRLADQASRQTAREAAEQARKDREDTKSLPGWPGKSYKAKAPTSKNRGKQFSDTRLATRLCAAVNRDLHEFSSFIRDIEVKKLPADVQENIRKFIQVRPGTKVAHYTMVADELVGKADPHNLASAQLNVEKRMSKKEASNEVHSRREKKPILIMNDRVADGHHFISKAVHGKVSSSLHVLDLTPARFQMENLQPSMIEL